MSGAARLAQQLIGKLTQSEQSGVVKSASAAFRDFTRYAGQYLRREHCVQLTKRRG